MATTELCEEVHHDRGARRLANDEHAPGLRREDDEPKVEVVRTRGAEELVLGLSRAHFDAIVDANAAAWCQPGDLGAAFDLFAVWYQETDWSAVDRHRVAWQLEQIDPQSLPVAGAAALAALRAFLAAVDPGDRLAIRHR